MITELTNAAARLCIELQQKLDEMGQRAENCYAFVAFDHKSQGILACGPTAALALRNADLLAPQAAIDILNAGTLGGKIWVRRLDLGAARRVIRLEPMFGLA